MKDWESKVHAAADRIAAMLRREKIDGPILMLAMAEIIAGAFVANYPEGVRASAYEQFLSLMADYIKHFEEHGINKK